MAGPQRGQWGQCPMGTGWLNNSIIQSMTRDAGWVAFYNIVAQDEISIANYWNDPNHQWSFDEFRCDY